MSALGHSRPSHFVPVLNNVRYASDSDHSRYESELTLWANNGLMHRSNRCRPTRVGTDEFSPLAVVFELSLIWLATALARRRSIDVQ
jgi:hypothetical protein